MGRYPFSSGVGLGIGLLFLVVFMVYYCQAHNPNSTALVIVHSAQQNKHGHTFLKHPAFL